MKAKTIFYVMVLITIGSCTQSPHKFPLGAWQEVSHKSFHGDSIVFDFPGYYSGSGVKMWSENNWSDIGTFKHDTTVVNLYAGGTYKLVGNRYEESIQFHFHHDWVGSKVKLLLELRNDTLIQTYPVDDNWKIGNDYSVLKAVRLK
jgi:hypothetical protein